MARDPHVEGADVVYRVTEDLPGGVFERMVENGQIEADAATGLALIKPGGGGA